VAFSRSTKLEKLDSRNIPVFKTGFQYYRFADASPKKIKTGSTPFTPLTTLEIRETGGGHQANINKGGVQRIPDRDQNLDYLANGGWRTSD
jgi:hypothetical protein